MDFSFEFSYSSRFKDPYSAAGTQLLLGVEDLDSTVSLLIPILGGGFINDSFAALTPSGGIFQRLELKSGIGSILVLITCFICTRFLADLRKLQPSVRHTGLIIYLSKDRQVGFLSDSPTSDRNSSVSSASIIFYTLYTSLLFVSTLTLRSSFLTFSTISVTDSVSLIIGDCWSSLLSKQMVLIFVIGLSRILGFCVQLALLQFVTFFKQCVEVLVYIQADGCFASFLYADGSFFNMSSISLKRLSGTLLNLSFFCESLLFSKYQISNFLQFSICQAFSTFFSFASRLFTLYIRLFMKSDDLIADYDMPSIFCWVFLEVLECTEPLEFLESIDMTSIGLLEQQLGVSRRELVIPKELASIIFQTGPVVLPREGWMGFGGRACGQEKPGVLWKLVVSPPGVLVLFFMECKLVRYTVAPQSVQQSLFELSD